MFGDSRKCQHNAWEAFKDGGIFKEAHQYLLLSNVSWTAWLAEHLLETSCKVESQAHNELGSASTMEAGFHLFRGCWGLQSVLALPIPSIRVEPLYSTEKLVP